jgi:hypothetical protein
MDTHHNYNQHNEIQYTDTQLNVAKQKIQSLMTLSETTMNTNTSTTLIFIFFCCLFCWENATGAMNNDLLSLADYKLRKMWNG